MALAQNTISRTRLRELSLASLDILRDTPARLEALVAVGRLIEREFGERLDITAYDGLGDLDVAFVEVLDQILFELNADTGASGGIDEYIVDDLYTRAQAFFLIERGPEHYRKNLHERAITLDDPIIIRHHRLAEFVPRLTAEFAEYPNLRCAILKTLLTFDDDLLLPFYYDIVMGDGDTALKIMALIGLHQCRSRFGNWRTIARTADDELNALVAYVQAFDPSQPADGGALERPYPLVFTLMFLEQQCITGSDALDFERLFATLCATVRSRAAVQQLYPHLHETIASIFMHIAPDTLSALLDDKRTLLTFLKVVDLFPLEGFEKILVVINRLGPRFLKTAERTIAAGEVQFEKSGPTLIGYILSLSAAEAL